MPPYRIDTLPARELFPGFTARLVHTPLVTQSFVDCTAGAAFPEHQHPHEQTVVMLEGELELFIDGATHRLTPGGSPVDRFPRASLGSTGPSQPCPTIRIRRISSTVSAAMSVFARPICAAFARAVVIRRGRRGR